MSDFISKVEEAVRATHIHSPTTFSWLGKKSPRLPAVARRILTPETARGYLLYSLREQLYSYFYCRGFASPTGIETDDYVVSGLPPFVKQLSMANQGKGYWSEGWVAQKLEGNEVVVRKGTIAVWAQPEDLEPTPETPTLPGMPVSVRSPRELRAISPGYYVALGNTPLNESSIETLVRFYWHIDPEGAAPLVRAITTALNESGYAFRFKVLNDPSHFVRCDAAVLYTHKSDYDAVVSILERIYNEIAHNLKPYTPIFTKQLASGLGFAEDPGGAESFGMHRCRILAEGLLRAHDLGHRELKARVRTVVERFAEEGINLEAPYLNPGSVDNYCFTFQSKGAHLPTNITDGREQPAMAEVSDKANLRPDYLRTAELIGQRLVRDAIWYSGLCNWMGASVEPNPRTKRFDTIFIALGSTVYTGTAGIALFLGELWAAVPEDAFRKTAIGAIKHAISRLDIVIPSTRPGLYAGWAGIALVAGRLGKLFHNEELTISASNIVKRLMRKEKPDWEADLLLGRAGAIAVLPILGSYLQDESFLAYAVRMADGLLLSADKNWRGLSWKSDINRGVYNLTGLSHGASGIGFALLELWRSTGETSYLQTAQLAFEYERSWFDDEAGNWPDFRLHPEEIHSGQSAGGNMRSTRSGQNRPFATAWCNGAPGIALARLRAYELLSAGHYKAEASAALLTTKQAVCASLESASGNYSLCHGLSGNTEILLYGAQVLGDGWEHASAALSVARTAANQGIDRYGDANRLWPSGLPRGQTPNLMLGLAGIGHFYLRLHNPAVPSILLVRKEDWTRTNSSTYPGNLSIATTTCPKPGRRTQAYLE